jgi:DNA-binding GntR family transcriptional regulator
MEALNLVNDLDPLPAGGEHVRENLFARSGTRITNAGAIRIAIENDIFTGVLRPGDAIDETELEARFDVSKTPVREAILQLVESGIVEKKSRRGATVVQLHVPRLIHLLETVSELEATCARFAATRISDQEKTMLADVHDQAAVALAENRHSDYAVLGRRFHNIIMDATHNSVLIETTERLARRSLPYRRFQLRYPGRSHDNQQHHDIILQAIQRADPAAASEAMRRHVTVQGDALAEYISVGGISQS